MNREKLQKIIDSYKKHFKKHWNKEKYKWEAVLHFKQNWDIDAKDFPLMLEKSLEKTGVLLQSSNFFPRLTIIEFAKREPETVRTMFMNLFNEKKELKQRVELFIDQAEEIRVRYKEWNAHHQSTNAVSTYLWLRYPDKYYIYKYSNSKKVADILDSEFRPKRTKKADSMIGAYKLYDEICVVLQKDEEIINIFNQVLTNDCYPDPYFKTLTLDFIYYVSSYYTLESEEWFPQDYHPGLTVDKWLELLGDRTIFTEDSLEIMKRMKDIGGEATCSELAETYGKSANFYNRGSSALAERIAKRTGCPVMKKDSRHKRWWPILYVGKWVQDDRSGTYIWKLRPELSDALDQIDLSHIELYASLTSNKFSKAMFLDEVYLSEDQYEILLSLLQNKKNIILQGPPGVGKTFVAKRLAYAMMGEEDDSRIEFIQFHQSYSYEDFIMGYKPVGNGFELREGVFYRFCERARHDRENDYFFIIDEINRGNLSKIFGELLMLIEKDYRDVAITLAYTEESFSVPENIYIIGMMNTADRSLALIDYALRRRFSFYTMEPAFDSEGFKKYQERLNNEMFDRLIEVIKELNREISRDDSLGDDFRIGHSYFCGQDECNESWLKEVIFYDILPMLKEYWFDDSEKIKLWENRLSGVIYDE